MLCSDFKNDLGKDIMAAEEGIASEAVEINRVWGKCRPEKEVTKCVCEGLREISELPTDSSVSS